MKGQLHIVKKQLEELVNYNHWLSQNRNRAPQRRSSGNVDNKTAD